MPIPDNYDAFVYHERKQQEWVERRPICVECKEHIQDEKAYLVKGDFYCETCMQDFEVDVEDYI